MLQHSFFFFFGKNFSFSGGVVLSQKFFIFFWLGCISLFFKVMYFCVGERNEEGRENLEMLLVRKRWNKKVFVFGWK